MGRKGGKKGGGGMKGFMKQTKRPTEEVSSDDDIESGSSSTSKNEDCVKVLQKESEHPSSAVQGTESRSQMRERHKKEMNAGKKTAANMGKKKKKESTDFIEEIRQRHLQEMAQFTKMSKEQEEWVEQEQEEDVGKVGVTSGKKSKSQRRREKEAQKEMERENRIKDEMNKMGTLDADLEKEKLQTKLKLKGFEMYEIRPDGHCLYKSIEHQISQKYIVGELRTQAAEELRSDMDTYLPFFEHGDGEDPQNAFLEYCRKVESTAEWGGEMEMQALSKQLKKLFVVYSADFPDNVIGAEFTSEKETPIRLCFMQHAYRLGAHYNSVVHLENSI